MIKQLNLSAYPLVLAALAFSLLGLVLPTTGEGMHYSWVLFVCVPLWLGIAANLRLCGPTRDAVLLIVTIWCVVQFITASWTFAVGNGGWGYWGLVMATWCLAWQLNANLSLYKTLNRTVNRAIGVLVPFLFGCWLLILWELVVYVNKVPFVLLPPPSAIWLALISSVPILWADFVQTFMKAVLIGYFLGCGSAFIVAILIDRSPFLQRGLLPLGNLASALPIIGVAPIMVMWFGFDWHSKAAVVVIMTFFPMLVNTVVGLAAATNMQHDLMNTYAASYWQSLFKMRLPMALPFIFNALKINSTLALIGAIVAEFFGTPIVGMGFRISTEVGRMNVDMVWAEIAVAALAGSLFYGGMTLLERYFTSWHASHQN